MKHYVYGSGSVGCLYDYGPNFCENLSDAIEDLVNMFSDAPLTDEQEAQMRRNLRERGIHYFANPGEAGADYCEITEHKGPMPEDLDND